MKNLMKNLTANRKINPMRCLAVLLVALMLTAMTACTEQDINTVMNVIEIAGGLASSDSEPADGVDQSEAESTAERTTQSEAKSEAQSETQNQPESVAESAASPTRQTEQPAAETNKLDEDGSYTTKDDVALYLHTYGHLPNNFITKKEAEALGWPGGNLEPYAPGKCIGGSHYGNYEGLLPEKKGRSYTECDIDTLGAKKRGAKRIIFSNDGLIYYTADHYETFELLYGEP